MIGQEILRLPEIPEGTPEAQLRAIRSYLYRLAEQLQYLLSTEQEARIRGQEVCSQEAVREIQRKILDSPQIARQMMGFAGKQLGQSYVNCEELEAFLSRKRTTLQDALYRLARLEDGTGTEDLPREKPCLEPCPGLCRQEGQTVRFLPFPREEGALARTFEDHWQIT